MIFSFLLLSIHNLPYPNLVHIEIYLCLTYPNLIHIEIYLCLKITSILIYMSSNTNFGIDLKFISREEF